MRALHGVVGSVSEAVVSAVGNLMDPATRQNHAQSLELLATEHRDMCRRFLLLLGTEATVFSNSDRAGERIGEGQPNSDSHSNSNPNCVSAPTDSSLFLPLLLALAGSIGEDQNGNANAIESLNLADFTALELARELAKALGVASGGKTVDSDAVAGLLVQRLSAGKLDWPEIAIQRRTAESKSHSSSGNSGRSSSTSTTVHQNDVRPTESESRTVPQPSVPIEHLQTTKFFNSFNRNIEEENEGNDDNTTSGKAKGKESDDYSSRIAKLFQSSQILFGPLIYDNVLSRNENESLIALL
jgi:hypothetical protein